LPEQLCNCASADILAIKQPVYMRKPLLIVCLLAAIVYACNQRGKTINPLLNTGKLPAQLFSVDITKDTILVTKNGAFIRIPHGALSAGTNTVQLEVKEAYSMQQILEAGLTTQSNGQSLSSGGMIYINAVGENNVKITQKISIATPTPFIEKNMQLFKGEVQSDSTINWTDPKPLPANPQLTALDSGAVLFYNNCASCHAVDKDMTGPALGLVTKRLQPILGEGQHGLDHLYEFTRNPAKFMEHEGYFPCLKQKFGGAMMTPFPDLTDSDLDKLYAWIENEAARKNFARYDNDLVSCYDSCKLYAEVSAKWNEIKSQLETDSVDMLSEKRTFTPGQAPSPDTAGPPTKVSPNDNQSLYYQFTVESFGWYNVDMLLRNNTDVKQSELRVRIQGQYKEQFSIYLVIPSVKLLEAGGPLSGDNDTYGFHKLDGTIPLPQNAKAFIIAMGEYEDQIIFAKKEFITQEKQDFDLELTTITKEALKQQIEALQLNDLTIQANDTKNSAALRNAIKELKKAEDLKPKNCNCDCFLTPMEASIQGAEGEEGTFVDYQAIPRN
jgi:mono/diheme cytochrome c family protein